MNSKGKILFVTTLISGVDLILDKIVAQCDSIKNLNYDVDLLFVGDKYELYFNNKVISNLHSKLGLQLLFFKKILKNIHLENYSAIYIRNPFVLNQISYLHFLQLARNNNCKIILEVPTFPYKRELTNIQSKIIYYSEMLINFFLKKYVSIILYSGDKCQLIYGIRCKQLFNIGNVKSIPLSSSSFNGNILKLIGVSSCSIYHAYERIIDGLYLYYKKKPTIIVEFHIVGTGPYHEKYVNLVKKYSLENFVLFHGQLYGKNLDSLFDDMHIGISSLGMHRIGLTAGSPLKTSEYAARGLHLVLSYNDLVFSQQSFCHEVPGNEQAIDIEELVHWYTSDRFNNKYIREFTLNNVSWEKQYENIFTSLLQ